MVKMIAKRYSSIVSKKIVTLTDRVASAMPLIRMSNSGTWRINLTSRLSRAKRSSFRTENAPRSPLPATMGITHVSTIIIVTNVESKTNHPSYGNAQMVFASAPALRVWEAAPLERN